MILKILIFISLFAVSSLEVRVESTDAKHLSVKFLQEHYPAAREQLGKGLELRFRYTFKLCQKYSIWFDSCADELVIIYRVRHDPVTESFRVTTDRLGDQDKPVTVSYSDIEQALAIVSRVEQISLELLPEWKKYSSRAKRAYLGSRLVISLRDTERSFLDWLPRIITLGLIDSSDFDSQWQDIELW